MGKKLLKFLIPVLAIIAGLEGMLSPRQASADGEVCRYYCTDPALTCCITCYRIGGSCVCPATCTVGPGDIN